jgi:hypothetical protein
MKIMYEYVSGREILSAISNSIEETIWKELYLQVPN